MMMMMMIDRQSDFDGHYRNYGKSGFTPCWGKKKKKKTILREHTTQVQTGVYSVLHWAMLVYLLQTLLLLTIMHDATNHV